MRIFYSNKYVAAAVPGRQMALFEDPKELVAVVVAEEAMARR